MGRAGSKRNRRPTARGSLLRARGVWFGLAALVVVGLAGVLAIAPMVADRSSSRSVPAAGEVLVSMAGFAPATLQARAGEDLALTFVNADSRFHTDGGGWHQFRIDALNVDVNIPPSSRTTATLQDLPAGTYEFYCDVCCGGKENPAMRGVLEVTG